MNETVFEQLAAVLDRLPNGFPRAELRRGNPHPAEDLFARGGRPGQPVDRRIGTRRRDRAAGRAAGRGGQQAPVPDGAARPTYGWINGTGRHSSGWRRSWSALRGTGGEHRPRARAHGGRVLCPRRRGSDHALPTRLHRVVPAHGAVKSEWVLPYDDVRAILLKAKTFQVNNCICRVQQAQLGQACDFPTQMCLAFSGMERPARSGDISQDDALAILEKSEEVGLVHTVSNVMQGVGYVCNCCGCCCGSCAASRSRGSSDRWRTPITMRSSTRPSAPTAGTASSAARWVPSRKERASPWSTGNTASAAACA